MAHVMRKTPHVLVVYKKDPYQQYLQEGASFKPRYLGILEAGSSEAPMRILDKAGIDVRSADFWRGGFRVVEESLKRLEALESQQMPG